MTVLLRMQRFDELRQALEEIPDRVQNESLFRWFAWQLAQKTNADDVTIDKLLETLPPLNPKIPASWSLHMAAVDRLIEKRAFSEARARLQAISGHSDILSSQTTDLTRRFALLAFHQGELEQALTLYRDLAQIPEEEPWALFRQITVLNRLNRKEEADRLILRLKNRHPDSYWSRQIR